jgi:hypothetical protein
MEMEIQNEARTRNFTLNFCPLSCNLVGGDPKVVGVYQIRRAVGFFHVMQKTGRQEE